MHDPWSVLGVERTASAAEVKEAYFAAAKGAHPDLHGGDSSRFLLVKDAFELIRSGAAQGPPSSKRHATPEDWAAFHRRRAGSPSTARTGPAAGFRASDFHSEARRRRAAAAATASGRRQRSLFPNGFGVGVFFAGAVASILFAAIDLARGVNSNPRKSRVSDKSRVEALAAKSTQELFGKGRRRKRSWKNEQKSGKGQEENVGLGRADGELE